MKVKTALMEIGRRLVDQDRAEIVIPAQKKAQGFWFGGGNMIADRDGGCSRCL